MPRLVKLTRKDGSAVYLDADEVRVISKYSEGLTWVSSEFRQSDTLIVKETPEEVAKIIGYVSPERIREVLTRYYPDYTEGGDQYRKGIERELVQRITWDLGLELNLK